MKRSLFIVFILILAGCGPRNDVAPEARVRAIEPFVVQGAETAIERRLPGLIQAAERTSLGFAVAGTVIEIAVTTGETVEEGALIARLDDEPYRLQVEAVRAQVQRANAAAAERRSELDRQRQLFEGGWISPAALEQYETSYETARSDVRAAEAQLGAAQRNLERTVLRAPYTGVIAGVFVDSFEEVGIGMRVAELNAEGALEIQVDAPDRLASQLGLGMEVRIEATTVDGCGCTGRIAQVGRDVGGDNSIPVTIAIDNPPAGLLPGMAASATISLDTGAAGTPIPFAAVVAGPDANQANVFVYDPDTSVVRLTPVTPIGAQGDVVLIGAGLNDGDIIAAAGTGLLRDGQDVRLPDGFGE
ncbi:MAG: efflux RND transporter periplasmic adaptor subunit [Sphingomonadales bacterium]|nr:MAG: efflux RND transporter periplasmic adaptor subunit [Sphingomonadales bacterium]